MRDAGYRMRDAGYRIQDTGDRMQDMRCVFGIHYYQNFNVSNMLLHC